MLSGLAVLAAACSASDGEGEDAGGRAGDGPGAAAVHAFTLVDAQVQPMAPQAPPFPEDVKMSVAAALDAYLGTAVVGPLVTGRPPASLEAVFTAGALGRVVAPGPDRAALVEEGAPLTGEVHQERADARLTALTAPGGEVVLVTAQVDVGLTVTVADGHVDVVRSGELVLVPDGAGWRIDAFDMRTTRDSR